MEWCTFRKGTKGETNDREFYSSILEEDDYIALEEFGKCSKKPIMHAFTNSIDELLNEIDQKVDKQTSELYKMISSHLTGKSMAKDQSKDNCEKGNFPLVVARCNFSELDTFEHTIKKSLERAYKEGTVSIIKISSRATVKSVIDDARSLKRNTHGILFIEQAECLSEEYINKLFWLLKWFKIFLPVVVCVSSDISSFSSLCSLRTLRMFEPMTIDMVSSKEIFDSLMTTITSSESTALQFSGSILAKLRRQFFFIDASVIESKNIIKFAMLNHNLENPTWVTKDPSLFKNTVDCYWRMVDALCQTIDLPCKFILHEAIQNGRFIKNDGDIDCDISQKYESWKRNSSPSEVIKFAKLLKELPAHDQLSKYLEGVDEAIENVQQARIKTTDVSSQEVTNIETIDSSKKKKRTLNELKMENEAKLKAAMKKNKDKTDARSKLADHIENAIKAIACPFTEYKDFKDFVITTQSIEDLSVNPYLHMEKTLLQRTNMEPVAVAYRTLQERNNWKFTSIKEWYQRFVNELPRKEQAHSNAAFFSSLGQLEAMGVVKAASDKQKGRIMVLHFPVMDC